jgi:hypothetical protein
MTRTEHGEDENNWGNSEMLACNFDKNLFEIGEVVKSKVEQPKTVLQEQAFLIPKKKKRFLQSKSPKCG